MSVSGRAVRLAVSSIEPLLGRRNLVRLGRLISMQARLDGGNDMRSNGELDVQRWSARTAPATATFVALDVGANKGEWAQALLAELGERSADIHLFEPASFTFSELKKEFHATKRVTLVNQALSNHPGVAQFFIRGPGLGTNSLHSSSTVGEIVETVQLDTCDGYCRQKGLSYVHLLKIDAEGHDMSVLEGAAGMLKERAVGVLQFEYNQRWIDSRHFLKDAFDLLKPFGYLLGKITPKGIEFYPQWDFELETYREGNYLACLEDLATFFPAVRWWNLEK